MQRGFERVFNITGGDPELTQVLAVTVTNDNSQKQKIEDTINNNADLKKAVVQYLEFIQAMAPSLENSSSSGNSSSGEISQLLSSLADSSGSPGAATLTIKGNAFQTSYVDANGNSTVLSSSLG